MQGIGATLVLFGIGSFVLNLVGREFSLLMWIDTWGATPGNIIRVAMTAVGAGLWVVGARQKAASE